MTTIEQTLRDLVEANDAFGAADHRTSEIEAALWHQAMDNARAALAAHEAQPSQPPRATGRPDLFAPVAYEQPPQDAQDGPRPCLCNERTFCWCREECEKT